MKVASSLFNSEGRTDNDLRLKSDPPFLNLPKIIFAASKDSPERIIALHVHGMGA